MSESRDEVLSRLGRKLSGLDKRQSESQAARMRAERFEELIEAELKLCEAQIAFVRDGGELIGVDDEVEPVTEVEDEEKGEPIWRGGVIVGYSKPMVNAASAEDYMIPDDAPVPDSKTGLYGF